MFWCACDSLRQNHLRNSTWCFSPVIRFVRLLNYHVDIFMAHPYAPKSQLAAHTPSHSVLLTNRLQRRVCVRRHLQEKLCPLHRRPRCASVAGIGVKLCSSSKNLLAGRNIIFAQQHSSSQFPFLQFSRHQRTTKKSRFFLWGAIGGWEFGITHFTLFWQRVFRLNTLLVHHLGIQPSSSKVPFPLLKRALESWIISCWRNMHVFTNEQVVILFAQRRVLLLELMDLYSFARLLLGNVLHFAYCGLVGDPHLPAIMQIFAPLPTSTKFWEDSLSGTRQVWSLLAN